MVGDCLSPGLYQADMFIAEVQEGMEPEHKVARVVIRLRPEAPVPLAEVRGTRLTQHSTRRRALWRARVVGVTDGGVVPFMAVL